MWLIFFFGKLKAICIFVVSQLIVQAEEEGRCADMLNKFSPHLYFKEYAYLCIELKSGKI